MPFANIKMPRAALSNAQKEDLIHRMTAMFVDFFGEGVRPYTMVLVEEVADGGYGRADEVFIVPEAFRAEE
ncbi:MAG: 4-oxalocrotonate tautomerase family protein [Mesorhizobium sp.]|nr:MAG: 4-oxalocrotonate tautomerase family protein [Mesorhizobium sp.]